MSYTVYMHKTPSNKVYIGITQQNVNNRWKNGLGYQTQPMFWRAIIKYGWNNIKHIIIAENLSKDDACKLEQELIVQYKSTDRQFGYNVTSGGDGTLNFSHKNPHNDVWKHKVSVANTGKKRTLESRKKMSLAKVGTKMSDDTKRKISQAHKDGRLSVSKQCKERSLESLRVPIDYYIDNVLNKQYVCMQDCADDLHISVSYVSLIVNNKRKSTKYDLRKGTK